MNAVFVDSFLTGDKNLEVKPELLPSDLPGGAVLSPPYGYTAR
jgi:hypothetical protein